MVKSKGQLQLVTPKKMTMNIRVMILMMMLQHKKQAEFDHPINKVSLQVMHETSILADLIYS